MDERTQIEKLLWNIIGEPLYYCEECKRVVRVSVNNGNVIINRVCKHDTSRIIAPRKVVLSGRGFAGLRIGQKVKVKIQQILARITKRNV